MSNLKVFLQRRTESEKKLRAMLDKAAEEGRKTLNESEDAAYEDELKALTSTEKSIEREEALLEREKRMPVVNDENQAAAAAAGAPTQKRGFQTFGEMLQAVRNFEISKGSIRDPRLFAGPAGSNEIAPSDGGFLVQKDFSAELLQRMYSTGQIVSRCRKIPISSNANGIKINAIDEDSRADGSRFGGVLAYWVNEAGTVTATKPKFRQVELQLQKLMATCYATDELLEDAAALESVIQTAFNEEMTFKVEDAIINGTGAGQPLGIMNSGALIQQAKDGGDSGVDLTTKDVLAMWNRLWVPSRPNAVWLADVSIEPKLYQLVLGASSLGQILLYTPPGENGNQTGMLMGRPVVFHEHGAVLGTPGDIVLADLNQYLLIDKGGVKQASSIHVNFLSDEMTFRFVLRIDGQSWWKKPLTPKSGGSTLSPFINLATRS
jgi:HK97 family phage major capsid protein